MGIIMCKKILTLLSAIAVMGISSVSASYAQSKILSDVPEGAEAVSLSGKPLSMPEATNETVLDNLTAAKVRYMDYPMDPKRALWYGRRLAYAGEYREAIKIFSDGMLDAPNNARFYRHRGHRYITTREFDRAIADLEKAAAMIKGKSNKSEEDGAPNEFGIPVSTLHGNIYYHLGLAYYLKQDFENAKRVYDLDFSVARNDDNQVSIAHWRYMIRRRMGESHDAAKHVLDTISADMNILENHTYHKLDLFYKGEVSEAEISEGIDMEDSADAATAYGIANWHYYNGDVDKARGMLEKMMNAKAWGSFGYVAAEADLAALK
jgi:tetratricopeptide (TPR) repeat protein